MKKLLLLPILFAVQSCAIYGWSDDYKKLNPSEKAMIVDADFGNETNDKIYKVTGTQLLSEIQKHPKALVYQFTNACSAESCKPMMVYEQYAKKHGYKLFLVMNGYGFMDDTMAQRNTFESPMYAIKSESYPVSRRAKYIKLFLRELAGEDYKDDNYGGLIFFENGKFQKQLMELPI